MDEEQLKAIKHLNGTAIVIAGPGCGKTSVISNRIQNLVHNHNVDPESIVALSFTRFSASELKVRTLKTDSSLERVFFGTIHSFFLKILTHYFHYPNFSVMGNKEKFDSIKTIISKILKTSHIPDEAIEIISNEISIIKSKLHGDNPSLPYISNYDNELIHKVYKEYIKWQVVNELLDFDDILIKTFNLLMNSSEVKTKIQKKYTHYIVDEFQDINYIQFNTLKLLLDDNKNLFVVGDEDQSIYGFRGASPLLMLEFKKHFPGASTYPIIKSYRCPQFILRVANNVISINRNRTPKMIEPSKSDNGILEINEYKDTMAQSLYIANQIKVNENSSNMVIFRTNNEALPFIKIFTDMNIPFKIKDNKISFFSHFIFKDIIAYMKAAKNLDIYSLNRIKNKPNRNLNVIREEDLLIEESNNQFLSLDKIKIAKTKNLINKIKNLNNYNFHKALSVIRKKFNYDKYLDDYCDKNKIDGSEFDDIFNYFNLLIESDSSISKALSTLNYLNRSYQSSYDKTYEKEEDKVKVLLVTAHGSKGLESDNVYLTSLNEGIFPHKKSIDNNIEEERRLIYVSITRAKKNLYLSYINHNRHKNVKPSRFIKELKMQEIK